MRQNIRQALAAFANHSSQRGVSVSTDGTSVFSYDTCILTREAGGMLIFNTTFYTNTTSQLQNAIRMEINPSIVVTGLSYLATAEDLRKAADDKVLNS